MPRRSTRSPVSRPRPAPASRRDVPEAEQPPRIIGGELKGKRLPFTPDGRTRPMKDRVREVLFDLVGPEVKGRLAIDLFAGSGALAFEAISRGAHAAVLAERHFPTATVLRETAKALGIAQQVEVRPGDVLLWSKRMPELDSTRPWVVFVSPPWVMFNERTDDLMALIGACLRLAPAGSKLIVESDQTFDPAALPDAEQWTCRPIQPAMLYLRTTALAASEEPAN